MILGYINDTYTYLNAKRRKILHRDTKDTLKKEKYLQSKNRDYAVLSSASYQPNFRLRYKTLREKKTQDKWRINNKLSHKLTSVFESDNEVVIAYRGTKCDTGIVGCVVEGDLHSDMVLALGGESYLERFQDAESEFEMIRDYYKDKRIVVTGHSLGGTIARHIHNEYSEDVAESHLFNPGAGVNAIVNPDVHENMHIYHIYGDTLSSLANYDDPNVYVFGKNSSNEHTLNNFL